MLVIEVNVRGQFAANVVTAVIHDTGEGFQFFLRADKIGVFSRSSGRNDRHIAKNGVVLPHFPNVGKVPTGEIICIFELSSGEKTVSAAATSDSIGARTGKRIGRSRRSG